jgi:asparagine synthase (glutamine-hydrolysing)
MGGIAGAVWTDPKKALEPDALQRMTAAARHRGPDAEGFYISSSSQPSSTTGVAMGHGRLSIIDLAGGSQPLASEDGSVVAVCDGEIYNFRALRRRLEGNGHRFRSETDAEVIVHLYEDAGPSMLAQLDGMFALAVWDGRREQLLLARDRLGEKPLVYRLESQRLLFASELKSIVELPDVPRDIDPQALDEYLTYQYVPHPRTIFRGISKLPPGHVAVYAEGRLDVRPYWQPDFARELVRPAAEYARDLRAALTQAVEMRLQSDVPLGAFLSGGVESTIVVGLMRQLGASPLRTFSIGFTEGEHDETRYARLAAERFETIHEEFRVEARAVDLLPQLVSHYDEPFADSSAIATWYLAQFARQHVTVALTGNGGDELFAGYPRYRAVRLASAIDRLPRPLRWLLSGNFWQALPASTSRRCLRRQFKQFAGPLGLSPVRRYLEWVSVFGEAQRGDLYRDDFCRTLPNADPIAFLAAAFARSRGRDAVTAASLADLVTYLPCSVMTKVDIASMAHGLECRCPLLDHRVVDLAAAMPVGLKFRRGRGKRILHEAFGDLLPGAIRRRGRTGFGVPLDHWFRGALGDFARDTLLASLARTAEYFRATAISRLLDEHQQNRKDHSNRLWSLLFLELWMQRWVSGGPTIG